MGERLETAIVRADVAAMATDAKKEIATAMAQLRRSLGITPPRAPRPARVKVVPAVVADPDRVIARSAHYVVTQAMVDQWGSYCLDRMLIYGEPLGHCGFCGEPCFCGDSVEASPPGEEYDSALVQLAHYEAGCVPNGWESDFGVMTDEGWSNHSYEG